MDFDYKSEIKFIKDLVREAYEGARILNKSLPNIIGVNKSTIWRWTLGKGKPTYDNVAKLTLLSDFYCDYTIMINEQEKQTESYKRMAILRLSKISKGGDGTIS